MVKLQAFVTENSGKCLLTVTKDRPSRASIKTSTTGAPQHEQMNK